VPPIKCCRSVPRCRNCPARRPAGDDILAALGIAPADQLPAHLQGVPPSLHKYEPLLRRSWEARAEAAEAEIVRPQPAEPAASGTAAAVV
jgi:hypothetical protein